MKATLLLCLFLYIIQNFKITECQTVANMKAVIKHLFTTNGYNKRVRPVADQSDPVPVLIDLYLVGIDDFDEVKQKLTTTGFLHITWVDTELEWNSSAYGNVARIQVSQSEIWKPDITLQNGKSDMKELGGDWLTVSISNDGIVNWYPFHNFETKCAVDVTHFPFDEQVCDIKFVAWSTFISEILIDIGKKGIILTEYEENGQWEITDTNSSQSKTSAEATVIYKLYLKRRPTFTVLNIITPILFLGFLNLFVFVLPADSGEKVGFSVTMLLAFAVFLTIVSDSLPKNSIKVPLLSIYLIIQVTVSTICVLLTIIQLRFFHRDESHPVAGCLKKFVRLVQFTEKQTGPNSCCTKNKVESNKEDLGEVNERNESDENLNETECNWKSVANALDYVFFWILFLIQFVSMITFFVITMNKLPY